MNLYLVKAKENLRIDYDQYDSYVVAETNTQRAFLWNPDGTYDPDVEYPEALSIRRADASFVAWPVKSIEDVEITQIGVAADGIAAGVILASFNGG